MRARGIAAALAATLWVAAAVPAQANDPRVPMPPHVSVLRQACAGYDSSQVAGCASTETSIEIKPGSGPAVYWHEVGHLFDYQVLDDHYRDAFRMITHDGRGWWGEDVLLADGTLNPSYNPPGERFAGAYSMCAMQHTGRPLYGADSVTYTRDGRKRPDAVWGDYGYRASWRRHQRVCALIWHAGGRHYTPTPLPRWRAAR